jgi:hypothetical protein
MESYLNTSIKEVITEFPKVGQILEEYNIGCVPCSVGLVHLAQQALENSKRKVPVKAVVVSLQGEIPSEEWI